MTNEEKLARYEYAVYIAEELLKSELYDLNDDWKSNSFDIYKRAKATTYKEMLQELTDDDKWNSDLDELKDMFIKSNWV